MVAVRDFRDLPYFPSGCSNPDYCLCSEIQNYIMFVVAMLKSRLSPGFEASKIYLVRFRDVQIPCIVATRASWSNCLHRWDTQILRMAARIAPHIAAS